MNIQKDLSIIQNIMQINYAYDEKFRENKMDLAQNYEKLVFDYENYLKPMTNKVIPFLYQQYKLKEDINEYLKLIKIYFLPEIKKELSRLELEEKNFDINLKKTLQHQIEFLYEDIIKYPENKEKQKIKIEAFFNDRKAEFITLFKSNPELFLSLIRETNIIHLQMLFFINFKTSLQEYLNSLTEEGFKKLIQVYFYYSPLDFKEYYSNADINLTSPDPFVEKSNNKNKTSIKQINLRLIKHIISSEKYNNSKKLIKIYK